MDDICRNCGDHFGPHFVTNDKLQQGCNAVQIIALCHPDGSPKMETAGDGVTQLRCISVKPCNCVGFEPFTNDGAPEGWKK